MFCFWIDPTKYRFLVKSSKIMQYSLGLFEGLVICYLWGEGGEWWQCPFREILKDFQTDPPIHHSFLEMASYCTYCESDVPPVRHGNCEYPGYKSCRSSPHTFSTVGVYYFWLLHSISYHAHYYFVLLSWHLLKWPPR